MQKSGNTGREFIVLGVLSIWHKAEKALAVAALTLILVLIFTDVFLREAVAPLANALGIEGLPSGLYGAQKKSVYLLVVAAFLGIGVSVATAGQIVPSVAFNWIPRRIEPLIDRLSHLLSAAVLFAVTWYGYLFILDSMAYPTMVAGLNWPSWIIQIMIPIGFLSAALRYLIFAIWPDTAPERPQVQE